MPDLVQTAALLALGVVVGLVLGLFGGGGALLAVPAFVYVGGVPPAQAVVMSLAIVGATSFAAAVAHHRHAEVQWRTAALFSAAGIVTAFFGARLTHTVPERALSVSFAVLLVLAGVLMIRRSTKASVARSNAQARPDGGQSKPRRLLVLISGAAVGAVTGFLGVGGGFLAVPALVVFARLSLRQAIGTSLVVIAANSAAGLVGHFGQAELNLELTAVLTALAISGALVGERVSRTAPLERLGVGFGVVAMLVGAVMAAAG